MKNSAVKNTERGAVLATSLMFMAILSLLGGTGMVLTTTDLNISSNYRSSAQALFDADAGISYTLSAIESGLQNGTFSLPTNIGNSTTLSYTVPSGFSFSISGISKIAENGYSFNSTGNDPSNSSVSVLRTTFARDTAINFAAFGDTKLDTKNGGSTQSYDSSSSDPTANDPTDPSFNSTHEADVGSNDWLVTHNGAAIDGDGVFGEQDDGSATTDGINGGTTFYGTAPVNAGRIDPDPLGVNSGGTYDPSTYSTTNDNNLADPQSEISGDTISLSGTLTLHGKSGGANYYLTDVELKNGSNLTIDATNGTVNLFLTGGFVAKNGSNISIEKNGTQSYEATNFSIFSNSSTKIDFKNSSALTGLVYAPYAPIDVKNSGDVYGSLWGDNVDIKNSGTVYFDSAIKDKHLSNNLLKTSWRDIRN